MAKQKTVFYCQNCGAESAKWVGKCPSCNEWNTYVEEVVRKANEPIGNFRPVTGEPRLIQDVSPTLVNRILSGNGEVDRVLGGGIVPGSLILLGGEPGIGKSTLLLQLAIRLQKKILYVSGEESAEQIKLRAERIGIQAEACYLLAETALDAVFSNAEKLRPDILVIDSIQTLYSDRLDATPGSVSQVKECTAQLMKYAKQTHTPIFLVGHINKDGAIAGPKVLEHMVDTVLQFEGDRNMVYRILRTIKNRFGSTSELGIFEMQGSGLREVTNPSEILILPREENMSGIGIGATMEGNRPLLIEAQALVSPATYGTPQRSATGYDAKRLNMILAVLEKRLGLRLSQQDVFLNIAGGLRIQDPSLDLAVCAALFSSYEERPISQKSCFAGEVGLGGEVRSVNQIDSRIMEAEKLGFERIYISKHQQKSEAAQKAKLEVIPCGKLSAVFSSTGIFD
jgi:DNA repair protein RadA/Sms